MLHNQSSLVLAPKLHYKRNGSTLLYVPYPPETTGFLYYFTSRERPRIAGELRLRVASSDDPKSFESGHDLLRLDGRPWSRSLFSVSKHYTPLYEKLREERLVSDDLGTVLSTFTRVPRCQQIYTLNDPFIVNLEKIDQDFTIITQQAMELLRFNGPLADCRSMRRQITPYTGASKITISQLMILINL